MPRKVTVSYGKWIPVRAVKLNRSGTVSVKTVGRRRNIAAGYQDSMGDWHPIRASWDYDPKRSGEKRPKGWKPKRGKRYSAASYRKKAKKRRR